jgi:hypothetical protein
MKILEIRDNGGKTFDRYTVVYDSVEGMTSAGEALYWSVGMSSDPFHPQGFGQHGEAMRGKHLGKKIKFTQLPPDCQQLVRQDLAYETKQEVI